MTLAVIDAFGNTFCIGDIINGYFPQELEFKHGDNYFKNKRLGRAHFKGQL